MPLMASLLLATLPVVYSQHSADFLGKSVQDQFGQKCVAHDRPCEDGVDCCGVCAYIGADTWRCLACTEVGHECIPMGNRCCDGGNRQKEVAVAHAQHRCQATVETSEKYGTTRYACQVANASDAYLELVSNTSMELQSFASTSRGISSNIRYQGKATDKQAEDLRDFAYHCFQRHPVRTSNLGELQATLGSATGCVVQRCERKWGWKPFLSQEGSDNGGPYEKFGHDAVVLGVETSSGKWQFVLKMQGSPHPAGRTVHSHIRHRGDATREQAHDLQQFAQACFKVNAIDTSNVGALQGSLGRATGCVVTKCERKWGWKPFLSGEGSDNGGPYGAHGLGATVVGVETTSGKWQFILRLKN